MGGRGGSYSRSGFLGPRGKQKTVDEALAGSNPHYREGREWQQNCQRCIYAYEMQRRGYDVEALPRIFDGTDRLPYMYDKTAGLQLWTAQKLLTFLPGTPFRKWQIKWRTGATVPAQSFVSNGRAAGPAMYLWPNSKRAAQSSWTRRPGAMLTSTSIWIRRSRARPNLSGSTT